VNHSLQLDQVEEMKQNIQGTAAFGGISHAEKNISTS
jgi:hypothetical protein